MIKTNKNLLEKIVKKSVINMIPGNLSEVALSPLKKITININNKSLNFLKSQAQEHKVPYQHIIQTVLDMYTEKYDDRKSA